MIQMIYYRNQLQLFLLFLYSKICNVETGAKDFDMRTNQELLEKASDYIYDICLFDDHVKKAGNIQVRHLSFS